MEKKRWMLMVGCALVGGALTAGSASATDPVGFSGRSLAKGMFEEFSVRAVYPLAGLGGGSDREVDDDFWRSIQKTKGRSDLYVQSNVWQPGGSTGWHTHPGHSLIIVTAGEITAYDGDDPCTPHRYSKDQGAGLVDANHVHMIRNETSSEASVIVVQLVPHGVDRRIDAAAPKSSCP